MYIGQVLAPVSAVSLLVGTCFAQTHTACNDGFCTETAAVRNVFLNKVLQVATYAHVNQLKVNNEHILLGIALPPKGSGLTEMLINASVPLHYGFLSFTLGRSDASVSSRSASNASPFSVMVNGVYSGLLVTVDQARLWSIADLRTQVSTQIGHYLLTDPNIAHTNISWKSTLSADATVLQVVSKIQAPIFGEQPLFTSSLTELEVTLSENPPHYLDPSNETTLLNLTGSVTTSFMFDRTAASFANYSQMTELAGV